MRGGGTFLKKGVLPPFPNLFSSLTLRDNPACAQLLDNLFGQLGQTRLTDRGQPDLHRVVIGWLHADHDRIRPVPRQIAVNQRVDQIRLMHGVAETHTLAQPLAFQTADRTP